VQYLLLEYQKTLAFPTGKAFYISLIRQDKGLTPSPVGKARNPVGKASISVGKASISVGKAK